MIRNAAVCLDEVEVELFVGVHDHEKAAQQRYFVSVRVEVDPSTVSPDAYFDYDPLMALIEGFGGQRIETHEEIAGRIWAFLEPDPRVLGATLSLRKPDIFAKARGVGLDVAFSR
ncbi:MAG: dihydroneopterin aldolase [Pseudomonadota bacterium]